MTNKEIHKQIWLKNKNKGIVTIFFDNRERCSRLFCHTYYHLKENVKLIFLKDRPAGTKSKLQKNIASIFKNEVYLQLG